MLSASAIEKHINSEYVHLADTRRELEQERLNTVYALVPEVEEIDRAIATVGVRYSTKIINGNISASELASSMEAELAELKRKRADALAKYGMNDDVFDVPYECPLCKDTGVIKGKKCTCYKQKIKRFMAEAASRISNIPIDFENCSFKNADFSFYSKDTEPSIGVSPYDNARNIYRACLNFCRNFDNSYENLYIYGPAGVGKTYLTSCMVAELLNAGHGVIYQTAYKLFNFLEDCHFNRSKVDNAQLLKNVIYDCDLLIIDDFGTEFITSYTQSVLFDLLNTRLLEKKSTIINSNLNMNDVRNTYTDRISSRIMGDFTLLKFVGDDIRLLKKERNM